MFKLQRLDICLITSLTAEFTISHFFNLQRIIIPIDEIIDIFQIEFLCYLNN